MPTYTWKNKETGELLVVQAKIADRNTPPDESGSWERLLEAASLMQASYPDGLRSKSDQSYDKLKKASQLKIDYANAFSGSSERDTIGKEIAKLEKVSK